MIAKLYIYRLTDVAYDINIPKLRGGLKKLQFRPLRLSRFTPAYLNFSIPPLQMEEKTWMTPLIDRPIGTQIKFFSLGSITARFEIEIQGNNYDEILSKAKSILNNPSPFDRKSRKLSNKLRSIIEKELSIETYCGLEEDYAVLWIRDRYDPAKKAAIISPTAKFLRNEDRQLSTYEQNEAFKYHFSYTPEDITIIDWDRTVTIGMEPEDDVWDVLEYVNIQLLELRYYEKELDKRLEEIYQYSRAKQLPIIEFYKTQKLMQKTLAIFIEYSSVEKRINNFLRLTGDEYLSRIYLAASARLNLHKTEENLKKRLDDAKDLYEMLSAELSSVRAEILEIIIIFLILFEIVYALI
ncbi:MAG: hypothetical protein WC788_09810 [Candidatus Paceibacterota bacterium]|jgi:hypothetical protein